jgi:hypothetical protein
MKNEIYDSNNCGKFRISSYKNARNVNVVFLGFSDEIKTTSYQIKTGEVRNPMYPSLYGTGFIGIGIHKTKYNGKHTACYRAWNHMIERCYSDSFHSHRRYKKRMVTVCDDWLNFQNFADWYFDHYIDGYEIDKDILNQDSKIYSPSTCIFVPQSINKLITGRKQCRGSLPIGVYTRKNCASFVAACNDGSGKSHYLGSYSTPCEAFDSYKSFKTNLISAIADDFYKSGAISMKLRDALYNYKVVPFPD